MPCVVDRLAAAIPQPIPNGILGAFVVITILYVYTQFAITYTHGSLIGTLAMVEEPKPTAIIRPAPADSDAPPPYADDPNAKLSRYAEEELLLLTPKPITASNHGTVMHLRRIGGRTARYRGVGVMLLYGALTHLVGQFIFDLNFGSKHIMAALAFVISQLALYRVHMLWTHIVISVPSTKRWYQRFVPRSAAKKVVLPTLAWSIAHVAIPAILVQSIRQCGFEHDFRNRHDWDPTTMATVMAKGIFLVVLAVSLLLGVYLPFEIILTRCQAAQLSEEEVPIVPFDRSYGGRVISSGSGLSMREAWRTFDWNARVRLLKVYVRMFAFQVLSTGIFIGIGSMLMAAWIMVGGK